MSKPDNDEALKALYPFLHDRPQEGEGLDAALLESVRIKAGDSVRIKAEYFEAHAADLVSAARALADCYRAGGRLFAMGNGGSSCDAAHVVVEFLHPVTAGRPALPAINLVADVAMLTAVANDLGIAHVYTRQLIGQARRGDVLLGISTSGNSENLMSAFKKARELGLTNVGLAGHDGGQMASSGLLDHCLVVPSDSIHRIQETHVAIYHILWDLVHSLLADQRGGMHRGSPA